MSSPCNDTQGPSRRCNLDSTLSPSDRPCTRLSMKQPSMLISLMRASCFPDEPCQTTSSDTGTGVGSSGDTDITVCSLPEEIVSDTLSHRQCEWGELC